MRKKAAIMCCRGAVLTLLRLPKAGAEFYPNDPYFAPGIGNGANGAAFDFETGDPYRNSVFAGAGVTAQFGERWNASVFYNVNFGSQTYQSNMVSAGLNFSF